MPRYLFHLTLKQELHGQLVQNGYYFRQKDPPSGHTPGQLCQFIAGAFLANIIPPIQQFANQQLKFQNIVVTTLSPRFGAIYETLLETANGNQTDDALPSYCAGLLSLRSGFGGGNRRGRSYYAGISEGDSADSRLGVDSLAALTSIGQSLLGTFGAANTNGVADYGIWSWKLAELDPVYDVYNTDLAFTPITQCIARPVIATQRHRKIGHGT